MADDDETPPPSRAGGGHGLGKKLGPFPLGAWAVILGGGVGLWFFLRRGKSTTDATSAADSAAGGSGDTTPTSLIPMNEGLSEDQTKSILDAIKKLHGAPSEDDDDDDDDDKPPSKTTLPGKLPHPPPKPKPVPKPKPRPKPGAPKTVTTVKWTRDHTPWNSTLWGIAQHEHVKGGWQYLQKINHMHGDPKTHLQPGIKIKL